LYAPEIQQELWAGESQITDLGAQANVNIRNWAACSGAAVARNSLAGKSRIAD
jgi:hypothetical protein